MTGIEYYKKQFPLELLNIKDTLAVGRGISIHSLISDSAGGHFGQTRQAFLETKSKPQFLFCFFYTVLIDQAIHSSLLEEHRNFEKTSGYPKFVGILSSYGSNMDPSLLLLIATSYLNGENEKELTEDFKELTDFLLEDYIDFFHNVFPNYSFSLNSKAAQDKALLSIFEDIQNSMKWISVPKATAIIKPKLHLYKEWIDIFNSILEKTIDGLVNNKI